jgi:hypothetical protein
LQWTFSLVSDLKKNLRYTGKSLLEALILASTNSEYDKSLFIDLPVQYMKTTSSEHVVYKNCFLFWHSKQFMYTTCSEIVVFMYWTGKSMNNLLSYCGLVDARISASEKDLPVTLALRWKMCSCPWIFVDYFFGHCYLLFYSNRNCFLNFRCWSYCCWLYQTQFIWR